METKRKVSAAQGKPDSMSIKETSVSNMREITSIVVRSNGRASAQSKITTTSLPSCAASNPFQNPETVLANPYIMGETEKMTIDNILNLFNTNYE